jgi:hypothetical protein
MNDARGELVALVTGAASGIGKVGRGRPEGRQAAPPSASHMRQVQDWWSGAGSNRRPSAFQD